MVEQGRDPNHLTVHEAAELLGVSKDAVYKLKREGKIAGHQIGRKIVVYRDSTEEYIRTHKFAEGTQPAQEEEKPKRKGRRKK